MGNPQSPASLRNAQTKYFRNPQAQQTETQRSRCALRLKLFCFVRDTFRVLLRKFFGADQHGVDACGATRRIQKTNNNPDVRPADAS